MRMLVVMCMLCMCVSIVGVVLVLFALGELSSVQAFDHAQTSLQLREAAQGAKVIPHAIATLENHLDTTIRAAVQHAAQTVATRFGR